jgi:hypothetical protein
MATRLRRSGQPHTHVIGLVVMPVRDRRSHGSPPSAWGDLRGPGRSRSMPLILHVVIVTPQSVIWMVNDEHMPPTCRNYPITRSHRTGPVVTTRMRSCPPQVVFDLVVQAPEGVGRRLSPPRMRPSRRTTSHMPSSTPRTQWLKRFAGWRRSIWRPVGADREPSGSTWERLLGRLWGSVRGLRRWCRRRGPEDEGGMEGREFPVVPPTRS